MSYNSYCEGCRNDYAITRTQKECCEKCVNGNKRQVDTRSVKEILTDGLVELGQSLNLRVFVEDGPCRGLLKVRFKQKVYYQYIKEKRYNIDFSDLISTADISRKIDKVRNILHYDFEIIKKEEQHMKPILHFDKPLFTADYIVSAKPSMPKIEKVIFNEPATIVFWTDGTKTVVKAQDEVFDKEKGLAMAITKKFLGNKGNYCNELKKWL